MGGNSNQNNSSFKSNNRNINNINMMMAPPMLGNMNAPIIKPEH